MGTQSEDSPVVTKHTTRLIFVKTKCHQQETRSTAPRKKGKQKTATENQPRALTQRVSSSVMPIYLIYVCCGIQTKFVHVQEHQKTATPISYPETTKSKTKRKKKQNQQQ